MDDKDHEEGMHTTETKQLEPLISHVSLRRHSACRYQARDIIVITS